MAVFRGRPFYLPTKIARSSEVMALGFTVATSATCS